SLLSIRGRLNILFPKVCRNILRSLAEFFRFEWITLMLVEGIWGERNVCAIQPVFSAISMNIVGVMSSGWLTSKTTSPVASSQQTADMLTPLGSIFKIVERVSSSDNLIDGSVLIMNLFFNDLDREER